MSQLQEAIHQRQSGRYAEAEALLRQGMAAEPSNPEWPFQMAWWCDVQGLEAEAAPFYEEAIALGLSGESLRGALLGLGSTYRWLGRSAESVATLTLGVETFPEDRSMAVFQALAWHQAGRSDEAVASLLEALVATTADEGIQSYASAIGYVVKALRAPAAGS